MFRIVASSYNGNVLESNVHFI